MKKNLAKPLIAALSGFVIWASGAIWADQSGYSSLELLKRDANIGAGLITLLGSAIGLLGSIWLTLSLIRALFLRAKSK